MYFTSSPNNASVSSPDDILKGHLLGGSIEYDMDLSKTECGCDTAIYLVGLPAVNKDGSLNNTDGFWYCDAQAVGGSFCPEFDIMEANKYAFHVTGHKCDAPDASGIYNNCDRSG